MGRPRLTHRGDIVVVALQGDSGKPRPAVVIQADWFEALPTVGRLDNDVMLAVQRALAVFFGMA